MSNNSYYNDQWRIINEPNQNKVSNYSMQFDGSSDFIDCGDSDKFSFGDGATDRPFSLSGWVKPDSLTKFKLFGKFDNSNTNFEYQFGTNNSKNLTITLYSQNTADRIQRYYNNPLTSLDWQHWVATYDGSGDPDNIKIYINGVQVGDTSVTIGTYTAMQNTAAPLLIASSSVNYANGKIDQVTVFDYELPATGTNSVATLYGGGTAITNPMSLSPKPIAYYQLGDQSVDNGANYLVPNNSLSDYVFNFDGTDDYIDCGNITALNSQSAFSTSAWVNYSGTPTTSSHIILSGGSSATNRFWVQLKSSTEIRYGSGSASAYDLTLSTMSSGTWYHIATVHNGTSLDVYLNGIKQGATVTVVSPSTTIGNNFKIGEYFSPVGYLWDGELSNISIFNTALSTGNIETLYNNGAPNNISSLSPVGWWKLNAADTYAAGSDWTITDYGSGGNDGTSFNMTSANLITSSLQQTSGYSPYALSLDGINDYLDCGDSNDFSFGNGLTDSPFSISAWVNMTDATRFRVVNKGANFSSDYEYAFTTSGSDLLALNLYDSSTGARIAREYSTALTSFEGQWIHVACTYDGSRASSGLKIYLNGLRVDNNTNDLNPGDYTAMENGTNPLEIGASTGTSRYSNGQISNTAIFNTELTSTEITEIFNEGRPGNLHNFSGTAPVSWWQIGSNSSYLEDPNPNPPNVIGRWTCLDEVGTNNAESSNNMTNDAITDGPGYSASGLGTSSIDIIGDAPYSSANGLSENMDVLDRSTDIPS